MTTWNLETVLRLCAEAGSIALRHFERPDTDFKADDSVVTQADREIERYFGRFFDRPEEGSYLLGEETLATRTSEYLAAAVGHTAWVVDPIDGTILYANHLNNWGVSVGFMEAGVVREGAVYFPLSGEIFITDSGVTLTGLLDARLQGDTAPPGSAELRPLATRQRSYSMSGIVAIPHELMKIDRIPFRNPIFAGGSAVYPLISVVQGRMIGFVGELNLWDMAGSLPMLVNSNAIITLEDGTPLGNTVDRTRYELEPDSARPLGTRGKLVIALNEETHRHLTETLESVAEPA